MVLVSATAGCPLAGIDRRRSDAAVACTNSKAALYSSGDRGERCSGREEEKNT